MAPQVTVIAAHNLLNAIHPKLDTQENIDKVLSADAERLVKSHGYKDIEDFAGACRWDNYGKDIHRDRKLFQSVLLGEDALSDEDCITQECGVVLFDFIGLMLFSLYRNEELNDTLPQYMDEYMMFNEDALKSIIVQLVEAQVIDHAYDDSLSVQKNKLKLFTKVCHEVTKLRYAKLPTRKEYNAVRDIVCIIGEIFEETCGRTQH